jgi:hypothetical protein
MTSVSCHGRSYESKGESSTATRDTGNIKTCRFDFRVYECLHSRPLLSLFNMAPFHRPHLIARTKVLSQPTKEFLMKSRCHHHARVSFLWRHAGAGLCLQVSAETHTASAGRHVLQYERKEQGWLMKNAAYRRRRWQSWKHWKRPASSISARTGNKDATRTIMPSWPGVMAIFLFSTRSARTQTTILRRATPRRHGTFIARCGALTESLISR